MGLLEDINNTEFLGSEFLTWLWYKSETNLGAFHIKDTGDIELWFYDNIKLEKGRESEKESIICTGATSDLKEAKLGLNTGKKLKEARIKIIINDEEWFLTLDSKFLDFKQLKTPKIDKLSSQKDEHDEDAHFYEKVFLIEKALSVIDNLFISFMEERVDDKWYHISIPAIKKWINNSV